MTNRIWRYIGIILLPLAGLLHINACHAQQKYSYTYSSPPQSSRYVHDYAIDVDDVPGHKVRIAEIQRTYTKDHPTIMGTKVTETWFRGFTNYIGGNGPGHGYETWVMENGDKIFLESTFLSSTEATQEGFRRGTSHSTSRFIGGTGKFLSIRGVLSGSTEFDTDPKEGYNRPTGKGEYWFEK